MIAALEAMPAGSIVVLHACCHNPTGVDPTPAQWDAIIDVVRARGLVPFLDIAYQGFADGIDADGVVVRRFAATPGPLFVSSSFSKSFSLYGERVGALSVVAADKRRGGARAVAGEARRPRQLLEPADARRRRSSRTVLCIAGAARAVGSGARGDARPHQADARGAGREAARARAAAPISASCSTQRGMFSYSGLTKAQVQRLRDEFSIYAVDTGRICVAALNSHNVDSRRRRDRDGQRADGAAAL